MTRPVAGNQYAYRFGWNPGAAPFYQEFLCDELAQFDGENNCVTLYNTDSAVGTYPMQQLQDYFMCYMFQFKRTDYANLLVDPDSLDSSFWTKGNLTVAEGGTTTQNVKETAVNATHSLNQYFPTPPTSTLFRLSVDVKPIGPGRDWAFLALVDQAGLNGGFVNFNVSTGAIGVTGNNGTGSYAVGTAIATVLGDGYMRIQADFNSPVSPSHFVGYRVQQADNVGNYLGDPTKGHYLRNFFAAALN